MDRNKILFIGGSLNQTTMACQVAQHLEDDYDCYFTPWYCTGLTGLVAKTGVLDWTVLGGKFREQTEAYLKENGLKMDYAGRSNDYDLVVTTSDLMIQPNIRGKKIVLIQEGMTDRPTPLFYLVKWLGLPGWVAGNTAANGLSNRYDVFCVASEGYRLFFIGNGVKPDKIAVTGIPNFDHAAQFLDNDFPYRNYVLVATSDIRETKRLDNRREFIQRCVEIAHGRPLIFKLHPNEDVERAAREIKDLAPHALILAEGNTGHMIANCDVLITQYSSVVYIGLALGKEVHSYFDVGLLSKMTPLQNGGASARNIAEVCRGLLKG